MLQSRGEYVLEFRRREREGIRFHAAGLCGLGGNRRDVVPPEAVTSQRWDFEIAHKLANPFNCVFGRRSSEKYADVLVSGERRMFGSTGAERSDVGFHSMWENGGADGAVRRVEHATYRRCKSMHDSQAGVRK